MINRRFLIGTCMQKLTENKLEVVTSFKTLMQLAHELGQARLSGDPDRISQAQSKHDAYRDVCLSADRMMLHTTYGEMSEILKGRGHRENR